MDPWWSRPFRAVYTIATEAFPRDERVWAHIDVEDQVVDFDAILAERHFSKTERLLLQIAADLWSGGDEPTGFGTMAHYFDDRQLAVVLHALSDFRGGPLPYVQTI